MLEKPHPWRSPKYRKFVKSLQCVLCAKGFPTAFPFCDEVDPHHPKQGFGTTKPPDFWAFPLGRFHHNEFQKLGWQKWEGVYGSQLKFALEMIGKALDAGWQLKKIEKLVKP